MASKEILVLGSIAYDYIMHFQGHFQDNLFNDPEKKLFNLSIMPKSREIRFGGTSGNISYNLAHLGAQVSISTAVGKDFQQLGYEKHLTELATLKFRGKIFHESSTASCYIVNDSLQNQLIIFHEGAMEHCPEIKLGEIGISPECFSVASVSPDNINAMRLWAIELSSLGIPFIFDPGQVTPAFSSEILNELIPKAILLIGNQFEIEMICKKLNTDIPGILKLNPNLVITKGDKGSICFEDGIESNISICNAFTSKDPTGAGDGYRAGLLLGLSKKLSLKECCRIGAAVSSFVIETSGPQTQKYTLEMVKKRYIDTFSEDFPL